MSGRDTERRRRLLHSSTNAPYGIGNHPEPGVVTRVLKVRVEDVNTQLERARSRGARVLEQATDHEYGGRDCMVEDLAGQRWQFSQTLHDVALEEWGGVGTGWHDPPA